MYQVRTTDFNWSEAFLYSSLLKFPTLWCSNGEGECFAKQRNQNHDCSDSLNHFHRKHTDGLSDLMELKFCAHNLRNVLNETNANMIKGNSTSCNQNVFSRLSFLLQINTYLVQFCSNLNESKNNFYSTHLRFATPRPF